MNSFGEQSSPNSQRETRCLWAPPKGPPLRGGPPPKVGGNRGPPQRGAFGRGLVYKAESAELIV